PTTSIAIAIPIPTPIYATCSFVFSKRQFGFGCRPLCILCCVLRDCFLSTLKFIRRCAFIATLPKTGNSTVVV
ncbi:MAG: hypothetical protein LAO18_16515, partial [Acidobacteriia bacterium]|nr:hypothetical protein [Terriglobia bacterium]